MIVWWIFALVIKILLVSLSPLTWDENYYWVWSQNLQLSYYDHPPMVAWLFALGNFLPAFMLKWPAVLFGHLFFLVWDQFLKNIDFSIEQRKSFFILAMFSPLVGLSTLALTPDLPLLLFIGISIFTFERALKKNTLFWYSLFGLALGLGFTSKYHIVLMVPGLLLYLIASKKWLQVNPTGVVFALIGFLVGASPVWIWNLQNEWVSFRFQLNHGIGTKKFKSIWPLEFILSQILFITPFFIFDFFKGGPRKSLGTLTSSSKFDNFFICIFLPIMIFFTLNSFKNKVEANWTQIAFPFIFSYLATKNPSNLKIKSYATFWGILLVVLLSQWQFNWWKNPPSDKLTEPFQYAELIPEMRNFSPMYATSYQMASYLWFHTKKPVYKIYQTSRIDFFDYFSQSKPQEPVFYVAKNKDTDFPEWFLKLEYKISVAKEVNSNLEILKVTR